jgi:hypothetical protein
VCCYVVLILSESGLALLEVQEGVGSGSTGGVSKGSSRRSLTPASEEHIKKLVADAIEKVTPHSSIKGERRVIMSDSWTCCVVCCCADEGDGP